MGNQGISEPMGIGELLDKLLDMFKKDFLKYYMITLIGYIPTILIISVIAAAAVYAGSGGRRDSTIAVIVLAFILSIPAVIGLLVIQGGLIKASTDSLFGRDIKVGDSLRFGLKRAFPFFVAGLLAMLAIMVGYVFLIIPGLMLLVWFSLIGQVTYLEKSGYAAALGRSRRLVKGFPRPASGSGIWWLIR